MYFFLYRKCTLIYRKRIRCVVIPSMDIQKRAIFFKQKQNKTKTSHSYRIKCERSESSPERIIALYKKYDTVHKEGKLHPRLLAQKPSVLPP